MNNPKKEITRCNNPGCPSLRSGFSGEWVLLKLERVMLYSDGTESTVPVYQCVVCGTLFHKTTGGLKPIRWSVHG